VIGCDRLGLGEGDNRLSQAGRKAIPGYRRLSPPGREGYRSPDREKIMRVDAPSGDRDLVVTARNTRNKSMFTGFLRFSARNKTCICYGLPEWFRLMFAEVLRRYGLQILRLF